MFDLKIIESRVVSKDLVRIKPAFGVAAILQNLEG